MSGYFDIFKVINREHFGKGADKGKHRADVIKSDNIHWTLSTEQTGDGTEQSIAHNLGVTPTTVIIIITGSPATYAALSITEGTHDDTNVKVTVTADWLYKVLAIA